VALARALVRRPEAFLMDEPLGALDADFRETMRAEIKRLHISQNATTIYVTHDQIEAMAMSDRIVVMSDAEIQQVGSPADVYFDPSNLFVARFIGSPGMNLINGRLADGVIHMGGDNSYVVPEAWRKPLANTLSGEEVVLGFRPEATIVNGGGPLKAEVYADDLYGAHTMLHLSLSDEDETIVHARAPRGLGRHMGEIVQFDIEPTMVRFFDPRTESAIAPED
jgi:multiple sugar transport system ATP-binding protein